LLVSACVTVAIRCPQCGQMELASVSRFALTRGRSVKLKCSCGSHTLTIAMKQGRVCLQVPCYLCESLHYLDYGPRAFWKANLEEIACTETCFQLGVFGGPSAVAGYAHPEFTELERLLEDSAFDDYFDHREVMGRALAHVNHLEDKGLLSCRCGSQQISIDIFPDHLELTCDDCGEQMTVKAQNEEDLAKLAAVSRLRLGDEASHRRKGHHKK